MGGCHKATYSFWVHCYSGESKVTGTGEPTRGWWQAEGLTRKWKRQTDQLGRGGIQRIPCFDCGSLQDYTGLSKHRTNLPERVNFTVRKLNGPFWKMEEKRKQWRKEDSLPFSVLPVWGALPDAELLGNHMRGTAEAFRQPAAQQPRLSSGAGRKSSGLLPSITGFSSCGSRSLLTHESLPGMSLEVLMPHAPSQPLITVCLLPSYTGVSLSRFVNLFPSFNRSLLHWEFFSSEQTTGILSSLNLCSAGSLYSSIW